MKARFTRFVAGVEIAIGILIFLAGVGAGVLVALRPAEQLGIPSPAAPHEQAAIRAGLAIMVVVAATILATPFIILGQLVLLLVDIRARLARIGRRWRRRRRPAVRESRLTDRLRPR